MIEPLIPENETERLKTLKAYQILDTFPEKDFDDITLIASEICQTPIALITFIDERRQWFKSHHGLDVTETDRNLAFCAHAILKPDEILNVMDSLKDERFHDNPLAINDPHVRFYAGSPLVTPEGQVMGTLCVIDHEPRNLVAEQLRALRSLSSQVVAQMELRSKIRALKEREKELKAINIELTEAKMKADQANHAKSTFLSNMSHEIRTPLNGVIGMAELLGRTRLNKTQKDYLKMLSSSSESLMILINDILDFSKIEAGKLAIENFNFRLRDSLENTLKPFNFRAGERGLELKSQVDPEVPDNLVGDFDRLRQILVNLIGNALKFTETGEVEVTIGVETKNPESVVLQFSVRDTGIGIPRKNQSTIFESFTQAETDTTRLFGGTGLGLAISAQLVEMMAGRIWLESEPGTGSTFHFTACFGIGIGDEVADGKESEIDLSESAEPQVTIPMKLLLVEDSPINQVVATNMLESQGHHVSIANNGQEAVEMYCCDTYDAILMDIQMPKMNGKQATAEIREKERGTDRRIPIIALTADAMKGDRERCLEADMDGYIAKPVRYEALFKVLNQFNPAT